MRCCLLLPPIFALIEIVDNPASLLFTTRRKIEFPLPDRRQKRLIFSTITSKMNLSEEVDLEDFVARPDKISGADINSICQEAGMQAVRENRYVVLTKDFEKGYKNNVKKDETEHDFYK